MIAMPGLSAAKARGSAAILPAFQAQASTEISAAPVHNSVIVRVQARARAQAQARA